MGFEFWKQSFDFPSGILYCSLCFVKIQSYQIVVEFVSPSQNQLRDARRFRHVWNVPGHSRCKIVVVYIVFVTFYCSEYYIWIMAFHVFRSGCHKLMHRCAALWRCGGETIYWLPWNGFSWHICSTRHDAWRRGDSRRTKDVSRVVPCSADKRGIQHVRMPVDIDQLSPWMIRYMMAITKAQGINSSCTLDPGCHQQCFHTEGNEECNGSIIGRAWI